MQLCVHKGTKVSLGGLTRQGLLLVGSRVYCSAFGQQAQSRIRVGLRLQCHVGRHAQAHLRVEVAGEAVAQRGGLARPVEHHSRVASVVDDGVGVGVHEGEDVLGGRQRRHAVHLYHVRRLQVLLVVVRLAWTDNHLGYAMPHDPHTL